MWKQTVTKSRSYLDLNKFYYKFYTYYNNKGNDKLGLLTDDIFQLSHQNMYLAKIYQMNNQVNLHKKQSAIEQLNLEKYPYATISHLITLRYIERQNEPLLKDLTYPHIYLYDKHLILGNNAIEQLNIVSANNLETYNKRLESVFDVVNKTTTPMGRRFLKENLLNPCSQEDKHTILRRYDLIEILLQNKLYGQIRTELKHIKDMERLHRKMSLGSLTPYEFYCLDLYHQAISKILPMINDQAGVKEMLADTVIDQFINYQIGYNAIYDFDQVQNYSSFADIDHSIFKPDAYPKIDKIQERFDNGWAVLNATLYYLTDLISPHCKKIKDKELISIEYKDTHGYYFVISRARGLVLKKELSKQPNIINICPNNQMKQIDISRTDFIFKALNKSKTKITISSLAQYTTKLEHNKCLLNKLIKKTFIKSMTELYTQHKQMLYLITKFVAELDFLVSGATVADQYHYCKPNIPATEAGVPSYLTVKKLRHVIIERLCEETEYVPNDLALGNCPRETSETVGCNGVIIYGLNSCGKSTLMKAIGTAIILAQMGYYVPASEFVYEPYMALYARITGNDNLFKGLSSFALEMVELDAILTRIETNGANTLVIGDEICRGTEDISARSIVASTLVKLSELNCTSFFPVIYTIWLLSMKLVC